MRYTETPIEKRLAQVTATAPPLAGRSPSAHDKIDVAFFDQEAQRRLQALE